MNVDRRRLGTSVVRVRVLLAVLLLAAAGCMVLGWGSRSRQAFHPSTFQNAIPSSIQGQDSLASPLTPAQRLSDDAKSAVRSQARSILASLPLTFEPNLGQANLDPDDRRAQFVARGAGYGLFLGSEGAILALKSQAPSKVTRVESLQMKLAGSNPNASLQATDPLASKSNYLLGNDPAKWRSNVPQFARVRYENVYPGINLVYYGTQGRLEYDFQVAPGADPSQAELEFNGANQLALNDGALVIKAENGSVRLDVPRVYQQIDGRQQPVQGSFVLRAANRVGFAIGPYDHTRELVIDPVLSYSTYFGGSGDEQATSIAVDNLGEIYIAGSTKSANLPAVGVFQTTLKGTQNVYIAKINPAGGNNQLIYVTYLGGSGSDSPVGIGVDAAGNPFVAGTTSSTDFPTLASTAYQAGPEVGSAGTQHVFVTELNNLNSVATQLKYSSYLSGNGDDIATGMAIDSKGNIYVTGTTTSNDVGSTTVQFPASALPQALPYQSTPRAPVQFFVTKVNTQAPKTGSIAYSTYFGGGNFATTDPIAVGGDITVDTNGNAYFTGTTNFTYTGCQGCQTTDFPILNAYQPCLDEPPSTTAFVPPCPNVATTANRDAFVAKLNPSAAQGQQLLWSTYLGGAQTDSGAGIALDSGAANVYVTGTTNSQIFTTTAIASYQKCLNNLPPTTSSIVSCTQQTDPAPSDAFVARLTNPVGTTASPVSLTYFSYLGGSANDAGLAIAVDGASGALLTGWTQSANSGTNAPGDFPVFPDPNSIQSQLNGPQDAFVARLNSVAVVGQNTTASWANYFGGGGTDEGTSIAVDSDGNVYFAGDTNSTNLQVSKADQPQNNGGYDAFATQLGTASTLSISGVLTLGTNQTYISAGSQATFTYTLTNLGPDLANRITVTDDLRQTTTTVPLTFVSASTTAGTCTGGSTTTTVSCNLQSLQSGSTATITIVLTPTASSSGGSATFNGGSVQASSENGIAPVQTSVSATMSDFTIQAGPSSVTVPEAGKTATYTVQLFPHPIFTTPIPLTVTGLPSGAAFSFTTSPVTLTGTSPASTTLNITTTARPVPTPVASVAGRRFFAIWLSVPGLALLGLGAAGDRRRRRIAGILLLCAVSLLLVLQPACSHSSTQVPPSGTPAGTYPLVVTATAGSDTKNANLSLTVP